MELPAWLPEEAWQEWVEYRRDDKKKTASERSQRMTLRKLARLREEGFDPVLLIEHAIEHEWQGIYAHEACRRSGQTGIKASAVERVRAANARPLRVVGEDDGAVRAPVGKPVRGDAL